jgi:hypothetical protein
VRVLTEKIQGAAKSLSEAESKLVQLKLVLMERQDRVDFLAVKKKACSQQVGILMMKSHSKELGSDVTELQRRAGETERELSACPAPTPILPPPPTRTPLTSLFAQASRPSLSGSSRRKSRRASCCTRRRS